MDTAVHAKKYTGYVRIPVTVIAESSAQAHSYLQMTLREQIDRASADPGICQITVAQNPKEITQQELEAYKDSLKS
ncbi:MAG: hypothetical protein IBX50_11160 [Marinospirillum sp.]|uniref:hypothetical protein n=1 Tax=Marinospirillum sp. TaxID=2183934 RepID=UPI0019E68172|nr:hypothetical protein [Marinospirillum sp.]MBE0507262.1 hypothetical protein [Marinospirillum sp.]